MHAGVAAAASLLHRCIKSSRHVCGGQQERAQPAGWCIHQGIGFRFSAVSCTQCFGINYNAYVCWREARSLCLSARPAQWPAADSLQSRVSSGRLASRAAAQLSKRGPGLPSRQHFSCCPREVCQLAVAGLRGATPSLAPFRVSHHSNALVPPLASRRGCCTLQHLSGAPQRVSAWVDGCVSGN